MRLCIYAVLDSKVDAFLQPFFMQRDGAAVRCFADAVNDPSSMLHKHPRDFMLLRIGEFDDSTGRVFPCEHVELGLAFQFLKRADGPPLFDVKEA